MKIEEVQTTNKKSQKYQKLPFVFLGQRTNFKILSNDVEVLDVHYIPKLRAFVECNGKDCEFCETNRQLYRENPKTFRSYPNYFPVSTKYLLNVYETTPAIICPNCGEYYKDTQALTCDSCKASLVGVQPQSLNRVHILRIGIKIFDKLKKFLIDPSTMVDDKDDYQEIIEKFDGEIPPIQAWNFVIRVDPNDKKEQDFQVNSNPSKVFVPEEISNLTLHNLKDAHYLRLSNDEMKLIYKGVTIRDVLNSRNSQSSAEVQSVSEDVVEDIQNAVDSLFG